MRKTSEGCARSVPAANSPVTGSTRATLFMRVHPNGTVWLNSIAANVVIRLNPATKEFTFFEVPSGVKAGSTAGPYGMAIDGAGYIWVVENRMVFPLALPVFVGGSV